MYMCIFVYMYIDVYTDRNIVQRVCIHGVRSFDRENNGQNGRKVDQRDKQFQLSRFGTERTEWLPKTFQDASRSHLREGQLRQADWQKDSETDRQTDQQTDRQTDRPDRQTDRQSNRQTINIQTRRQTGRQTDRKRQREIYTTTYTAFRKTRNETEETIEKDFTAQ